MELSDGYLLRREAGILALYCSIAVFGWDWVGRKKTCLKRPISAFKQVLVILVVCWCCQ